MRRELLQQALNALLISAPLGHAMEDYEYRHRLIKDIEAELAKPEQIITPISPDQYERFCGNCGACLGKPWVGLTGTEINHIFAANVGYPERMCLAIQAKLKEKNGG